MTCSAGRPTFRLLDSRVGWTDVVRPSTQTWVDIGLTSRRSISTGHPIPAASSSSSPLGVPAQGAIDAQSLLASLPPRRLAPGCGPGSWLLLTPGGMVLRRDPCTGCWRPIWCAEHLPEGLECARALASNVDRFAIAAAESVQVWTIAGEALVAEIEVKGAEAVAFDPWRNLFVATFGPDGFILLQRFGPLGDPLDRRPIPTTVRGPLHCLAIDLNEKVWLVTGAGPAARLLWRRPLKGSFKAATAADLAHGIPTDGIGPILREWLLPSRDRRRRRHIDVVLFVGRLPDPRDVCSRRPRRPSG